MFNRFIPYWVFPVLFLFALGTVGLRLSIVNTTYEIDQASKMIKNANLDAQKIDFEVTQLKTPRHLEALAKKKFGLHPPSTDQIVQLSQSR